MFLRASDHRTVVLPWHHGDITPQTRGHQIIKDLGLSVEEFLELR